MSGASLALTVPPEQSPWQFYKKRAKAVFPLFWLAWVVCFSIRFLSQPGYYTGAKTITLVLTFLGLDNFAVAAGWVGTGFRLCRRVVPRQHPVFVPAVPAFAASSAQGPGADLGRNIARLHSPPYVRAGIHGLVAVHIPEFLFGMTFLTLKDQIKAILGTGACLGADKSARG